MAVREEDGEGYVMEKGTQIECASTVCAVSRETAPLSNL